MKNIEYILNDCLNKAMCQKGRIQQPDSNKIAEFVSKYVETKQCNLYGVIWRLSAIVLVPLLVLLYIIYMPIKWLITGKFGFTKGTDKNKYEHLIWLWIKKIGL